MTRFQLIAAGAMGLLLIALMTWQHHRERLVKACVEAGGVWDGARSACAPGTLRPILRRDLERS